MIKIEDNVIRKGESAFIIAEAGVNHNGSIDIAKQLIDVAVESGADAVKFQTFKADKLVTKRAEMAEYQKKNTKETTSQYEMLKNLELSYDEHVELYNYCKKRRIIFLSTPFDLESVDLLESIGVEIYKVGSGEITNMPLLKYIASKNKPIILSTGMANLGEIEEAINWIQIAGNQNIILLHCTTNYPTDYKDVNLKAMLTLKEAFKLPVGYSDHSIGIEIPIAAVAMGARVIEKHFTLDNEMKGPDHKASLEPKELGNMVASIRNVEKSFGSGVKKCSKCELENVIITRKSIVAKKDIDMGSIITEDMLTIKRPGHGISPKYLYSIIGMKVKKKIEKDETISWADLEND